MGPDTDTAATTRPAPERTGAETDATPGCRSATLAAQPCRRTRASVCALNTATATPRCNRSGSSHASSTWAADPAVRGSRVPIGTVFRKPSGKFGRRDAHPHVALSPVELGALAGRVTQLCEHRTADRDQAILTAGRRELRESRAEHESALTVAGHQPVSFERNREPVRRRSRQAGQRDQAGEGGRAGLESGKYGNRLVQNANTARLVHVLILPSQHARRKFTAKWSGLMGATMAEKVWDEHVVRHADGEPDLRLHRHAPRARGDQPAGL